MSTKPTSALWQKIRKMLTTIDTVVDAIDVVTADLAAGKIVEDTSTGTPKVVSASSSATANTFGSWAEIDASTSADSWLAGITVSVPPKAAAYVFCIEIGTGAAASELTKIRISFSYQYKSDVGYLTPLVYSLPMPIKVLSGTRIAARASDDQAAANALLIGLTMYQK